jgi:hypothetical protein
MNEQRLSVTGASGKKECGKLRWIPYLPQAGYRKEVAMDRETIVRYALVAGAVLVIVGVLILIGAPMMEMLRAHLGM